MSSMSSNLLESKLYQHKQCLPSASCPKASWRLKMGTQFSGVTTHCFEEGCTRDPCFSARSPGILGWLILWSQDENQAPFPGCSKETQRKISKVSQDIPTPKVTQDAWVTVMDEEELLPRLIPELRNLRLPRCAPIQYCLQRRPRMDEWENVVLGRLLVCAYVCPLVIWKLREGKTPGIVMQWVG